MAGEDPHFSAYTGGRYDHADIFAAVLVLQVMEKGGPSSPTTATAKQRLRKSFGFIKAQVDIDLLQYRKDAAALLDGAGSPCEDRELLQECVPAGTFMLMKLRGPKPCHCLE